MSMPVIRLRQSVQFPANVYGGTGIAVSKINGNYTIDLDYSEFGALTGLPSSTTTYVLSYDTATKAYVLVPTGNFLFSPSDAVPTMDGVASAGTSALYSRGDHVHPSDTSRVAKAGDTMTGNLIINKNNPTLALQKFATTGDWTQVVGTTQGFSRWALVLGSADTETGSGNAGSNFELARYTDPGVFIDRPIVVSRSNGQVSISNAVDIASGTFTTGGRLNIGGVSPTTARINILLNGGTTGGIAFQHVGSDNASSLDFYNIAGTRVGVVATSATGTAYTTISDERLKEDLRAVEAVASGNIVDGTNVYDFAWKSTKERAYGIVAQQAVEVYPAAITHDEVNDWWGVDYSKYIPVLLNELKALRKRVAELEGSIAPKLGAK